MLCDQIIAAPDDPIFGLTAELQASYRAVGERLRTAQRYVLDRSAVMTIHSISESTPRRFLQALQICRLPHPSMWIEFAFQDRTEWMDDAVKRGMVIEQHVDASPPSRLGFYLEALNEEGTHIGVLPCWSHPGRGTVSICHMALTIKAAPDDDVAMSDEDKRKFMEEMANKSSEVRRFHKWMSDPAECVAGANLEARINETIPPYMEPVWAALLRKSSIETINHLRELSQYDLRAEWRFVLALLTVLNSRNVIEIGAESDMSKINKARLKKGSPPLMTHRTIRLNFSKIQRNRMGTGNAIDLQRHLVSGHWKLRSRSDGSASLFWWSPFVRGNRGQAPVTTTIVRG